MDALHFSSHLRPDVLLRRPTQLRLTFTASEGVASFRETHTSTLRSARPRNSRGISWARSGKCTRQFPAMFVPRARDALSFPRVTYHHVSRWRSLLYRTPVNRVNVWSHKDANTTVDLFCGILLSTANYMVGVVVVSRRHRRKTVMRTDEVSRGLLFSSCFSRKKHLLNHRRVEITTP